MHARQGAAAAERHIRLPGGKGAAADVQINAVKRQPLGFVQIYNLNLHLHFQ